MLSFVLSLIPRPPATPHIIYEFLINIVDDAGFDGGWCDANGEREKQEAQNDLFVINASNPFNHI